MLKLALMMLIGMSLIPAGDTAGKLLQQNHDVAAGFVAWARFVVGAMAVLPLMPRGEAHHLRDGRLWLRGALLAGGIVSILTALSGAPLADAFAGLFVGPLVSVILSAVLLREEVTPLRWLLVILGFVGVLLVVRPSGEMNHYMIIAVMAGLFYGGFLTASRWVSGLAHPRTLLASQLVVAAVLTLPLGLWFWPALTPAALGLLLISGLCSAAGNLTLLLAYRQATASQVAPFVYFQLLAATGLGYLVFADVPVLWTWLGMGLIALAGILSTRLPAPRSADRG